jgi:beta-glucosidase
MHVVCSVFSFVALFSILPVAAAVSLVCLGQRLLIQHLDLPKKVEKKASVVTDAELLGMFSRQVKKIGFADSLFQSCGIGTSFSKPPCRGRNNWNEWVEHPEGRIEGTPESVQTHFLNYLDDPKMIISILQSLHATAYRFSLERSVIEPEKGKIDEKALKKHIYFCLALQKAGIEPWITLNHFAEPKWFSDRKGFASEENVKDFIAYATKIISRFRVEGKWLVTHWMTFNEVAVDPFQHYIRKVYPMEGPKGIKVAAEVVKNMLVAHTAIYEKVKATYPDLQVGLSHQWLQFAPNNRFNPVERAMAYVMSIFTHLAVYEWIKTGYFRIPFFMNTKIFEGKAPLDFLGIQSYGFPLCKVGVGSGKEPGQIRKWKIPFLPWYAMAGATCKEGCKVSSFGPPFSPEDMEDVLKEASRLNIPMAVTETGCDAKLQDWGEAKASLDNLSQMEYFRKVFRIFSRFRLEGLFIWTLFRRQLEWETGTEKTCLGLVDVVKNPKNGKIKKVIFHSSANYVRQVWSSSKTDK